MRGSAADIGCPCVYREDPQCSPRKGGLWRFAAAPDDDGVAEGGVVGGSEGRRPMGGVMGTFGFAGRQNTPQIPEWWFLPRSGHCRSADYLAKVLQVMKINASNWLSVI